MSVVKHLMSTLTSLESGAMDADETTAADAVEQDATQAAVEGEEQPTQLSEPLAEGETESIHAWSQADDVTEVTPFLQRSWKATLALSAAAVLAAVGVGAVVYNINDAVDRAGGQRNQSDVANGRTLPPVAAPAPPPSAVIPSPPSGPAPTPRPSEPVLPSFKGDPAVDVAQKQDAYFLDLLGKRGWPLTGPTEPLRWEGRNVCAEMEGPQHLSYLQVTKQLAAEHSTDETTADMFVDAAVTSYCPHELGY